MRPTCAPRSVHPRACGEHTSPRAIASTIRGSSPRLRGTRHSSQTCAIQPRFIPAPAGNTAPASARLRRWAVHPRACGEHPVTVPVFYDDGGSSPRQRGTLVVADVVPLVCRFIPAPGGNTHRSSRQPAGQPVHPRACGEHRMFVPHRGEQNGSSPRLRGTPRCAARDGAGSRFIPAPAGNTSAFASPTPEIAVHPRACGEHE